MPGDYRWPLLPGKGGGTIDLRHVASVAADTTDTLFLDQLAAGWYAVTNTRRQVGFGMAWPLEVFPALWFWQVYGGAHGAPWYGRTYNIALEPFSAVQPTLVEAIAAGSARVLEPGGSVRARFVTVAYAGLQGVSRISPEGEVSA